MPELPEVETVKSSLQLLIKGFSILTLIKSHESLRYAFEIPDHEDYYMNKVVEISRHGKYLIIHLSGNHCFLAHLGMSGSFRVEPSCYLPPRSHDHIVITFAEGKSLIYNDPRRFGFFLFLSKDEVFHHPSLARLGPDPFSNHFHSDYLISRLSGRNRCLKSMLLDQAIIAGIGNIYASEALFLAGLSPERSGKTFRSLKEADALVQAIRHVLKSAIDSGGSTLRNHKNAEGVMGYFQHHFSVYNREGEPCPRSGCQGTIRRIVQQGRSTFFCPQCQVR